MAPASLQPRGTTAERRVVSVLFADLVGFTAGSEDQDPEDVREFLGRYFDASRRVIERYGGTVEKFIGDAVMAVWGAPIAHEDDAERAVRAALDLVELAPTLDEEVRLRAAVLTGEAAVTIGATGHGLVAGDLVNTASRLQAAAEPGTVLVGDETFQAASAAIAFEPVGHRELRGKRLPVAAWRAIRVVAERRGAGRGDGVEPPFVGRVAELRLLKDLLDATASAGGAKLVTIVGQAGIGKSRLLREFRKYVDGLAFDVFWHEGRSPAYGEGITFWALGEMVRERAGIAETDDEATTRARVAAAVATNVPKPDERSWIEPALLALLGVGPAPAVDRNELFAAWRTFFERISERGPTVLAFEDLDAADPGLLDFVEELLDWGRSRRIVVIALARPELLERRPSWGAAVRSATTVHLDRLSDDAIAELLAGYVPGLPADLLTRIAARSEGVPLYAVEIVRMLINRGRLHKDGDRYRISGTVTNVDLPASLHALVAARLDALDPADRDLVHVAAVLGQTFTIDALAAVAGTDRTTVERQLRALARTEIVSLDADPRSPERGQYGFVQSVLREVAYATLGRRERRSRHLAAARYFEVLADDELAGVLASHFVAAYRLAANDAEGETVAAQARIALRSAAERASALHSHRQALDFLEQAMEVTRSPRDLADLMERGAESAESIGALERAGELLAQAAAIRRELGDRPGAVRAIAGRGHVLLLTSQVAAALELLEEAAADRGELDEVSAAVIDAELARAYMFADRPGDAEEVIDRALAVADVRGITDLTTNLLITKSWAMAVRGRQRESFALVLGGIRLADEFGILRQRLRGRYNTIEHMRVDSPRSGLELAREGIDLAQRFGHRDWLVSLVSNVASTALYAGEWDWLIDASREHDSEDLSRTARTNLIGPTAVVTALRGDSGGAREMFRPLSDVSKVRDSPQDLPNTHAMRALLELACGATQSVWPDVDAAIAAFPGHVATIDAKVLGARAAVWARDLVRLDHYLGEVRAVAGDLRWATASLRTFEAARAALGGDARHAADLYADAFERWRALDSRLDLGLALLEYVELGQTEDERVHAAREEARGLFEGLRATALLARLDRAGASADGPARPAMRDGTPSAPAPAVAPESRTRS